MIALLVLLALSWTVRKWFAGATPEDVEGFFMCKEVAGDEMGDD